MKHRISRRFFFKFPLMNARIFPISTLVWIAEKTIPTKNKKKVFKLRLWRAGSIVINEIHMKWKLNSSPFNRHTIRYIQASMRREISTLKGEENLTERVSFLQSKLVWNSLIKLLSFWKSISKTFLVFLTTVQRGWSLF